MSTSWDVEFEYSCAEPSPKEVAAARQMYEVLCAAIPADAEVRIVRLAHAQLHRIQLKGGVLHATFESNDPPHNVEELRGLLAAIL